MATVRWEGWPHVLETQQFDREALEAIMAHASKVEDGMVRGKAYLPRCSRRDPDALKVLTIYRDEPSTRTERTFAAAGSRLGYQIWPIQGPLSSEMKGESFEDLVMAVTQVGGMGRLRLTDFFVCRTKVQGGARRAVDVIEAAMTDSCQRPSLPVINAGDGAGQHPTQALVDLATIYRERRCFGHPLENVTLVMSGDTCYSRTVNSLCHLLGRFGGAYSIRVIFSSHRELLPKEGLLDYLKRHGIAVEFEEDLTRAVEQADIVYMTRIQKERLPEDEQIFQEVSGKYVIVPEHIEILQRRNGFVMHPLPIDRSLGSIAEIDKSLEFMAYQNHPQCSWARQSMRGVPVRYALVDLIQAGIEAEEHASVT